MVALSPVKGNNNPMYVFVIGGEGNSVTWVSKKYDGDPICEYEDLGIFYPNQFNLFKISFNYMKKKVTVYQNGELMILCRDMNFIQKIKYFSFTSVDNDVSYSSILTK